MTNTIYKGTNRNLRIVVRDSKGAPLDLPAASAIWVALMVAGQVWVRYKLSPGQPSPYRPLSVDPNTPSDVLFTLHAEDSKALPTGQLTAELKAELPNTDFPNGKEYIVREAVLGTIAASALTDLP